MLPSAAAMAPSLGATLQPLSAALLDANPLSQQARLLTLQVSQSALSGQSAQSSALQASLMVDSFTGHESINQLFCFDVTALSESAGLPLQTLIGEEIRLRLLLVNGSYRTWHGYCTEAAFLGADGGLARYRLRIEPFLAFLRHRQNALVWQDKTVQEIISAMLAAVPQMCVRWDVTQTLPTYALRTQYRESDFDFICRLLAEEGLNWRFEHAQEAPEGQAARAVETTQAPQATQMNPSTWVIFDAAAAIPALPISSHLRFHGIRATDTEDAINEFSAERQVTANAVSVSSWDAAQLIAPAAEQLSSYDTTLLPLLNVYQGQGAQRFSDSAAADVTAQRLLQGIELTSQRFTGQGSVRHVAAGFGFSLTQHDQWGVAADGFAGLGGLAGSKDLSALSKNNHGGNVSNDDGNYTVLSVRHAGWNNLPAVQTEKADKQGNERSTYRNHFTCVRADRPIVPIVPATSTSAHRSRTARGPQVAFVVGVASNPITSERNHQIKIQFPWQRGVRPMAGGLTVEQGNTDLGNAPGNEQSGTWVRVAESLAGPNWGCQFTPRIGTEVLVDFIDGDMDQPIVVACLYNGCDTPPFSAGVDSGVNHAGVISGHHSHGLDDASQYNQWVVDDTRAQCRMRLASSAGASQLNLGYLIHQAPHSAVRGSYRGQGFELRTDAWGVLRGAQGILLTTHNRANAASTQLDSLESRAQLTAANSLAKVMQQAAQQQQAWHHPAASLAMVDGAMQLDPMQLGKHAAEVNGQSALKPKSLAERALDPQQPVEQFAQAMVHIDSAASMNFATATSTLLFAGKHLQWTTQSDTHWAAAHSIASISGTATSLFTHSGGLQAIAANGQVSLQAHTDALELFADKDVTVISANGHIEIKAKKKISLMAGQAAVTLEDGNISFACPGKITVKGGQHLFDKGARKAAVFEKLPDSRFKLFDEAFILKDEETGEPIPHHAYRVKRSDGSFEYGQTDEKGHTHLVSTDFAEKISIEVL